MLPAVVKESPGFVETVFEDEAEFPTELVSLSDSPYFHVRRICCYVRDGVARLEGYLPTYHQKQLAQEMVRRAPGVHTIQNHVIVSGDRR